MTRSAYETGNLGRSLRSALVAGSAMFIILIALGLAFGLIPLHG